MKSNRDREPLKRPPPTAPYIRVRIRRLACYLQRRFIGQIEFTSNVGKRGRSPLCFRYILKRALTPVIHDP